MQPAEPTVSTTTTSVDCFNSCVVNPNAGNGMSGDAGVLVRSADESDVYDVPQVVGLMPEPSVLIINSSRMSRRHTQEYAALLLFASAKLLLFQLVAAADIPYIRQR
jgi:hypothetical protein